MKNATRHKLLCALSIWGFGACASDTSPNLGHSSAALSAPGLTPVPCGIVDGVEQYTWNGTRVELLLADAFAGCASQEEAIMDSAEFPLADRALRDVVGHMKEALPFDMDGEPVKNWRTFRANEDNNCDADNISNNIPVKIATATITETLFLTNQLDGRPWTSAMADMDLRWAGLNLCMAMRLREISPGTSGAEALLMSNAEQRELLEDIRERSQIAMLQYALLGSVFASDGLGIPLPTNGNCPLPPNHPICLGQDQNSPERHIRIPFLQYFGRNAPVEWLTGMGQDFATAVQLHTTVTQEITNLLARSRSAGLERGGDAETQADETWGAGSWQQRLMAADYGGDPLATDVKSPWQHPFGLSGPAAVPLVIGGALDWPSRAELPYVRQPSREPQIETALSLLKSHDVLDFDLLPPSAGACRTIDIATSATARYTALELAVRESLCLDFDPVTQQCAPVSVPPADPEQHALFLFYRIRPEHVASAVKLVADLIGPEIDTVGNTCPYRRSGSHDVLGSLLLSGNILHVGKETTFAPRRPRSTASALGRFSNTRFAPVWQIEPQVPSYLQGFSTDAYCDDPDICLVSPPGLAAEAQRTMGAIRALTATRELVAAAVERLRNPPSPNPPSPAAPVARLDDYFTHADAILKVTSGAVGTSFTLQPISFGGSVHQPAAGRSAWAANLTADPNDPFFTPPPAGTFHVLVALPQDGWLANLAAYPATRVFGRGIPESLLVALLTNHFQFLTPTVPAGQNALADLTRLSTSGWISLENGPNTAPNDNWTALVWRGTVQEFTDTINSIFPNGTEPAQPQLFGQTRLLTASVQMNPLSVTTAEYFSEAGALGSWVSTQLEPDSFDATEPAFDAFGFPRAWVPPANAQILGGVPGTPAFRHYLDAAEKSSTEAAGAVETAMEGLLAQVADEAKFQELETKLANETTRSLASMKESSQELCGYDNPSCNIVTEPATVLREWYPAVSTFVDPTAEDCAQKLAQPSASNPSQAVMVAEALLGCIAKGAIISLTQTDFQLATPVKSTLSSSVVPEFQDFAGGEIQSGLIEQWRAVKAPDERLKLMLTQIDAAVAAMKTAAAVVGQQNLIKSHQCGFDDLVRGMVDGGIKGAQYGAALGPAGATVGGFWGASEAQQAHIEKCQELGASLGVAIAKQYQTSTEAIVNVTSTITGLINDRAAIVQSGVRIQQLTTGAKLEKERYQLELDLFESNIAAEQAQLKTSFGLYRRYRSYDAWRAKALLDNARRYSVAARRGIEAHYVVDLARISQAEAFVASPSSWANEVYEYDLSLPAAVGVAVPSGSETPGGIFSNKVGDYVANLNGFVDGFAITRPSAVAEEDVEVVTLRGLAPGQEIPFDPGGGGEVIATFPDFGNWQVNCPGIGWGSVPPVALGGAAAACIDFAACGCPIGDLGCVEANPACPKPHPTGARVVFALDPWGRLNETLLVDPFDARYNSRWSRLAVNLVGTGIRDCKLAPDPLTCYGEGFLRFDLRHVGRAWITDFAGQWRALGVPPGQIEAGKALAAEVWLDPLKDGWQSSYISPVARTEFFWRPFGGSYVLEIETGPEVRLERLERVQLLMGSSYWVKQE